MSTTYSSEAVSKALHASPRQLQWWDEHGLIQPAHIGHRRYYSETDLMVVSAVIKLRQVKVSLQKCRKVIRLIYAHAPAIQGKLAVGAPVYLLARLGMGPSQVRASIHYTHAAAVVEALRAGPVVLLEIGPELQNVRANPTHPELRELARRTRRARFLKSVRQQGVAS